ncbi:magnesium protoporphyrin IX methyltransferase [Rhodobacter veldkampii DSM 11550]|uniref:Magnesium protoporphyrin IX methyltransferase n=1 Tax=Phaeovulum veldkampii DSM 11550 TaxID=1185920 RepID=A0A2T4JIL5_9RHOB|nr:magnesium protoporphyrin IX methyltransferase [Phaeovulum veldkampii]MBK5947614.1 magnesium protoporphyrin IX methyltransferase [Phaeovulum veldkampii DSM 11550]NCU20111.1 magnesium protoporphyrin IX methyltransferase [Candidatus Falkowbacteria bacterium]PTE17735.1 magnesium protoporphyrin IX methyltransferase [Phaeovulum veldkampii DSM 11550]TDQ58197.1 Mg-protoporphyrin IX methyltransferase [Phaeovulum veldkampii DSM 11550]
MESYDRTRARLEHYFDRTAARTWERLTSDAPVSGIRQTVREGRDKMRAAMMARLPDDMRGLRVLDAGCGAGPMTQELAARGADVVAVDISPSLLEVAQKRMPAELMPQITWHAGDMLDPAFGNFDYVMAMDSLIHYTAPDIAAALGKLLSRTRQAVIFTLAPKTPMLSLMHLTGKLFPRSDRSPEIIPHSRADIAAALSSVGASTNLTEVAEIRKGFYISLALELRP